MKKKLLALSITLTLSIISSHLLAAGDPKSGANKVAACAGCHGERGNSTMPLFPKLASQNPTYLLNQQIAFKDGTRNDPTMSPMVLALDEQDMADIAAYYAKQKISSNPKPELNDDDDEEAEESASIDDLLALGSKLYRNGNLETGVSACIACHGPNGKGNLPAGYPALYSQHADYLIKTLNDFKSLSRSKNKDNMMHMIAKKMSEEEIKAVAYHISVIN